MTSSYKNRQALNPTNRINRKIKDLEAEKNAYVREATGQLRDQQYEHRRAAKLEDFVIDKELKDLSKHSEALNNFLQKAAVPMIKGHWDAQIEKGRLDYLENNQKFQDDKAEVEQAIEDAKTVHREINKKAQKQPTETQKQEGERQSGFRGLGWKLAAADEAARNFSDVRMNLLTTSKEVITAPGYTASDGSYVAPRDFVLSEYSNAVEYEAASKHIFSTYLADIRDRQGLSAKYLNTKVLPYMQEAETRQKSAYFKQLRLNEAAETIEAENIQLQRVFLNSDSTPEQILQAARDFHINTETAAGVEAGPHTSGKKIQNNYFQKLLESAVDQIQDEDQLKVLLDALETGGPEGHPSKVSFLELNTKVNRAGLEARYWTRRDAEYRKGLLKDKLEVDGLFKELINTQARVTKEVLEKNPNPTTEEVNKAVTEAENQLYDNVRQRITNRELDVPQGFLAEFKTVMNRDFKDATDTRRIIMDEADKKFSGNISTRELIDLQQLYRLDEGMIKELKQRSIIIDNPTHAELTTQDLTKASDTITEAIRLQLKKYDNLLPGQKIGLDNIGDRAREILLKQAFANARELKNDPTTGLGEQFSNAQYLEQGVINVIKEFVALQQDPSAIYDPLYIGPSKEGFGNLSKIPTEITLTSVNLARTKQWVDDQDLSENKNALVTNLNPYVNGKHFVVYESERSKIDKIFYEMAAKDPSRNVYQIYNAQAVLWFKENMPEGLVNWKPVEMDDTGKLLDETFARYNLNKYLLKKGQQYPENVKVQERILEQAAIPSTRNFKDALVFSSSSAGGQLLNMVNFTDSKVEGLLQKFYQESMTNDKLDLEKLLRLAAAEALNEGPNSRKVDAVIQRYKSGGSM